MCVRGVGGPTRENTVVLHTHFSPHKHILSGTTTTPCHHQCSCVVYSVIKTTLFDARTCRGYYHTFFRTARNIVIIIFLVGKFNEHLILLVVVITFSTWKSFMLTAKLFNKHVLVLTWRTRGMFVRVANDVNCGDFSIAKVSLLFRCIYLAFYRYPENEYNQFLINYIMQSPRWTVGTCFWGTIQNGRMNDKCGKY